MLFVDGLGIGSLDPDRNPLMKEDVCPHLKRWLLEEAAPVDAQLSIPGLPQSATGQATLLTGINAAQKMGRHVEGFPPERLKSTIREYNVFSRLKQRGYVSTFANAYYIKTTDDVYAYKRHSVTTVSALAAFDTLRTSDYLFQNKAVYHDITREALKKRGYTGPVISPAEAAMHTMAIAQEYDFTLFEFFQTDMSGHKGVEADRLQVLKRLDAFIEGLCLFPTKDHHLLLLTSDHGNIEDSSTRMHTTNKVPLIALGFGAEHMKTQVAGLQDVVPALMGLYGDRK